jgi:hypothetical protein
MTLHEWIVAGRRAAGKVIPDPGASAGGIVFA